MFYGSQCPYCSLFAVVSKCSLRLEVAPAPSELLPLLSASPSMMLFTLVDALDAFLGRRNCLFSNAILAAAGD